MIQTTCLLCQAAIPAREEGKRGRQRIYCSKICSRRAARQRVTAICESDGCERKVQARGMCGAHYGVWYKRTHEGAYQRSRESEKRHERVCVVCSRPWMTTRRNAKLCSDACRSKYYSERMRTRCMLPPDHPVMLEIAKLKAAERQAKREARVASKPRVERLWVSGPCGWCGENFTTYTFAGSARYCSHGCTRRAARARRRASEAGAAGEYTWAEVARLWIKLGKRCAYCNQFKPLDQIQPDHVVPLSAGGSNSITNIVPACAPCNGDKRHLSLSSWYADRARRGLEPRRLNDALTHLTWALLEVA